MTNLIIQITLLGIQLVTPPTHPALIVLHCGLVALAFHWWREERAAA
jgi:hypothetical protein